MKKIGLIINPIAGMGGSVGLKGTDHVAEEALRRGAVPGSEKRAEAALSELLPFREELVIASYPGAMGGRLAEKMGFHTELLCCEERAETDAADTVRLAESLVKEGAELLLFAGGDGTARDIYRAVGAEPACVGIPAGVKIHSPVYAKNPQAAGKLAALWILGKVRA